jgi:phosphatidylethanolamine-binding protein (PEBP) family uncharacterized protein
MRGPSRMAKTLRTGRAARHDGMMLLGATPIMLAAALALAGCGSSSPSSGGSSSSATAAAAKAAVTEIPLKSPAITHRTIPATYTCDGRDVAPPLEWGSVPPATRELALFALGLKPTGVANRYSISVEWAVAGVKPALHRLAAGQLPPQAHLGRTSSGRTRYSICPARGTTVHYQFFVFAVPPSSTVPRSFEGRDLLRALTSIKTQVAGDLVASYTRR